jgi:uncharacterized protein (DUF2126 family)
MCAEPRNGILYIFMPPVESLEDYLGLVAAMEATAEAMRRPVLFEGYEPPRDPRLINFRITPDPGVIEVNIQPSARWDELVEHTTFCEARGIPVGSEKIMIDGRHTGTGGGNHCAGRRNATTRLAAGSAAPGLCNGHPSLSYMFSGLFIGPVASASTSTQRLGNEIEVAFREMERRTHPTNDPCPPWLIDRLMRHLLIDVTGNTHRSEFCIDKLYSPDSATGRLGLLEMRAFGCRPHCASLTQQLLLRSSSRASGGPLCSGAAGALGYRAARPFFAAALRLARLQRRDRGIERGRLPVRGAVVCAALRVSLSEIR